MRFCKNNLKFSNVINTFLSLLLTVVRGSRSGRWCRTYASLLWDILVLRVCLQEQRKQSFLTLAKENQSPLGWYPNPPTFLFTNPNFVLLICDWRFVSSLSAFVINHITPTSYVIRWNCFRIRPSAEVREKCLLCLKFLQKCMDSLHEAFIHPLEPREVCFIMDACTLFGLDCWKKHPLTTMITLGLARTIFNITLIGLIWKKNVIYTKDASRVSTL